MKSISIKLQDQISTEMEALLQDLGTSRNKYINEAIEFYNKHQKRKLIEVQLMEESTLVSEDSMNVLVEFEKFEDEI